MKHLYLRFQREGISQALYDEIKSNIIEAKRQTIGKCVEIADSCCSCETDKICRACIVKEEIREAFDFRG